MSESYSVLAELGVKDAMSAVLKKIAGLTESLDSKMGSTAKTGVLMGAGMKLATAAIDKVSSSVGGAVARFDTLNNFPKIMNNLGVSATEAGKQLDRAGEAMKNLPTSLDDAASGIQRMTSTNGDVKKSTDYFLAMNDAIIAGGQSTQVQASALEQLSQSYSKGKMDMQEWRSIQQAMPAQLKQVADAMGMTATELGEGLRSGSVSMDEFMDTLVKLDKDGVKGMASFRSQAEDACGGIQTAFANVNTAITRGLAGGLTKIDKSLKSSGLPTMGEMINNLIPIIDSFFSVVSTGVGWLVKLGAAVGKTLGAFVKFVASSQNAQGVLVGLALVLGTLLIYFTATKVLAKAIAAKTIVAATATKVFAAAQAGLNAVLTANPIGLVVAFIAALVVALVIAYKKSDKFRAVVKAVGAALLNMATSAIAVVKKIFTTVSSVFSKMSSIGTNIVKGLWNGAKSMLSWAVSKFKGLGKSILNGIKSALGIHSPSREFAKVGRFSALGLIKGAEKMTGKVQEAFVAMSSVPDPMMTSNLAMQGDYSYGARYEVVVPLEINGREFARATASNIQDVLNQLSKRDNRKLGVI